MGWGDFWRAKGHTSCMVTPSAVSAKMKDELVGKRLREYAILDCIGRGGMAKVYKARHVLLDELRAIKLLRPELSDSKEFNTRFRREAQILVKLKHRHLVSVYDFGLLGQDVLFMVMEYLEGESLRKRLRRLGWLPPPQAIQIAKQVALGLATAHTRGIVHRDVSPDNIVMVFDEPSEIAKIIDFGVAKNVIAVSGNTITDALAIVGKAQYCSPEQIQGMKDLDGRTDVYSLGVTLYELLTGARPFQANNPQAYVTQHLTGVPAPFGDVNPLVDVPPALEDLVMRMLSKNRESRPASMEELFMELTAASHEMPVLTPS